MAKLRLTLTKSPIGRKPGHLETVKALGLRKIGSVVEREDTSTVRGMVDKVKYLLKVEEL